MTLGDLESRPAVEIVSTFECAGNGRALLDPRPVSQPWLNEAVGTARWRGVPLAALLEEAGASSDAVDVVFCGLDHGVEGEVYVTAPGAEIAEDHPLIGALDEAHAEVFGAPPERDVTRWFSDASALTRYGVPTVNYGTSTGLLDTVKGENLEIDGLVKTAEVYARAAMKICGVAE